MRIALVVLTVAVAACGGAAEPSAGGGDTTTTEPPPTTGVPVTTSTQPEEAWWPWVEASAEGFEPDARFLEVEPPHMAVLAAVLGYDLTAEPEGDDWERGALAGLWTNPFEEYFIGVAGPDATEIAGRAAATAAVVGGDVTVYIGNYTEDELNDAADAVWETGIPLLDVFTDITTNRVVVTVAEGDAAALEVALEGFPADLVHLETFLPPEPVDPNDAEIEYRCGAIPATADGRLVLGPLDADAEAALLSLFGLPEGDWLPDLEHWGLGSRSGSGMVVGAQVPGQGSFYAEFEVDPQGRWAPRGWGGCSVQATLPGYGVATWEADGTPDPGSTRIAVLATEMACAGGQVPGDRQVVPVVVETPDAVTITVFVEPVTGAATCQGNPPFPVEVELAGPLADRHLVDGSGATAP